MGTPSILQADGQRNNVIALPELTIKPLDIVIPFENRKEPIRAGLNPADAGPWPSAHLRGRLSLSWLVSIFTGYKL
jgi:hypothetical protein